jgi:hypothetical protein
VRAPTGPCAHRPAQRSSSWGSGIHTSSPTRVWLPVPASPAMCQSRSTTRSRVAANTAAGCGGPSPSCQLHVLLTVPSRPTARGRFGQLAGAGRRGRLGPIRRDVWRGHANSSACPRRRPTPTSGLHDLRPGPQRQRLCSVATGLGQEQRTPCPAERRPVGKLARQQHPSGRRVRHDALQPVLRRLRSHPHVRWAGSRSSVRSEHSSSRRSAAS